MGNNPNAFSAPGSAATNTPYSILPYFTPEMYGAVGNGTTDDHVALQAAITAAQSYGGTVILGPKSYATSTALNITSQVNIRGQGQTVTKLIPKTASQIILLLSTSRCTIEGLQLVDSNAVGNVIGLKLGGPIAATNYLSNQNTVRNITYSGLKYGRILQITGSGGQCYENNFIGEEFVNTQLGVYYSNPSVPGNGGPNANNTWGFSIYNAGGPCNGGIYIQAGAANNFAFGYIEGMVDVGPLPVATAVKIEQTTSDGLDNNSNKFYGVSGETNTIGLNNNNALTEMYSCNLGVTGDTLTKVPALLLSGSPSITPFSIPGLTYQSNSQIGGVPNLTSWFNGTNGAATSTGPIVSATYFATRTGTTGSLANGATFTITLPTINCAYDLAIVNNSNYTLPHRSSFGTDGTSAVTATVQSAGGVTLSITGVTVTVTNATGGAATFKWALTQRTA